MLCGDAGKLRQYLAPWRETFCGGKCFFGGKCSAAVFHHITSRRKYAGEFSRSRLNPDGSGPTLGHFHWGGGGGSRWVTPRSFFGLTSKIPPLGSVLNFDVDVKNTTARHQFENCDSLLYACVRRASSVTYVGAFHSRVQLAGGEVAPPPPWGETVDLCSDATFPTRRMTHPA